MLLQTISETEGTLSELDDVGKERERRESGSAERTLVHIWHSLIALRRFPQSDLQRAVTINIF